MDFAWSAQQDELYEAALRFAQALPPLPIEWDQQTWWRLGQFGLLRLSVPAGRFGMGLDALTTARVIEAFGKAADPGLVFSACAHLFMASMTIATHAPEAVRRRVLPRLGSGAWVGAGAITEADAGSDIYALKTVADRVDGGYRLNGCKTHVTNGPVADAVVVYASTNPSHGHLGISAFLVERETPGFTRGAPYEKTALAGAPVGPIFLTDCRIPEENRLGAEGAGAAIFQSAVLWERACLFALYIGAMERDLESALTHARDRRQFGRPLGRNQAVSHRLVDMKLRLEAARWLLYRACWLLDQGADATIPVSLAKIAVSEAALQSGLDAMRLHGGNSFVNDAGIALGLFDALPSVTVSGTSDIQREIIARHLGL
ncbi:acyl-CoA dehydrogenase family protein [Inquilinus sp. OTU3971]|uniref:acyl-CoA dehydrogenase family protein n=1 Tax=Inquilinus sp. OTU3971 TaxID=3043855 RepID=UPI00313CC986